MKNYFFTVSYDVVFTASSEESAYDMLLNGLPKQDQFHEDFSIANIELYDVDEEIKKVA